MTLGEKVVTGVLGGFGLLGLAWSVGTVILPGWLADWEAAGRDPVLLHLALLLAATAAWNTLLAWAGPMALAAARAQWTVDAPERRPFVRRLALVVAATATSVGVLVVVLPLWSYGAEPVVTPAVDLVVGSVLAAGLVVGLALGADVAQRADAPRVTSALTVALASGALAVLAWSRGDVVVAVVVGLVVLAVLARLAAGTGRPAVLPGRWSLARAAENRWAARASVVLLDGSVARSTAERRRGAPLFVASGGRVPGSSALTRVLVTTSRQVPRTALVALVGTYLAVCVAEASAPATGAGLVVTAVGVAVALTSGVADRWAQAPALARTFAHVPRWVPAAAPVVAATAVAAVGVLALRPALPVVVLLLVVPVLVVLRRLGAQAAPDGGPAVVSPAGVIPLGIVNRVVAGWDVVLVALAVLTLF